MRYLIVFAVAIAAVGGCRHKENIQIADLNERTVSYSYVYDGNADTTTVTAHVGGIQPYWWGIENGELLTFNGDTMLYSSLNNEFYLKLPGMADTGAFAFRDSKGIIYTHSFGPLRMRTLRTDYTTIHQHHTDSVFWDGGVIKPGLESVDLVIRDTAGRSYYKFGNYWNQYVVVDTPKTSYYFAKGVNNALGSLTFITAFEKANGAPKGSYLQVWITSPDKILSVD